MQITISPITTIDELADAGRIEDLVLARHEWVVEELARLNAADIAPDDPMAELWSKMPYFQPHSGIALIATDEGGPLVGFGM